MCNVYCECWTRDCISRKALKGDYYFFRFANSTADRWMPPLCPNDYGQYSTTTSSSSSSIVGLCAEDEDMGSWLSFNEIDLMLMNWELFKLIGFSLCLSGHKLKAFPPLQCVHYCCCYCRLRVCRSNRYRIILYGPSSWRVMGRKSIIVVNALNETIARS